MKRALPVVAILLLPFSALLVFRTALSPRPDRGPAPLPLAALPGSALPRLTASPSGAILLSWVEPEPSGGHRLRFSTLLQDGWAQPKTVARGDDWFVNWADFPSLTEVDDDFWAAHWLVRSGSKTYDYDIQVALSRDRGRTWSAPITPHRDGIAAEHGFVAATPHRGRLALVWLDGRDSADPSKGAMSLRFATLTADGELDSEALLDDRVCDCCQTAIAATPAGLTVAYRDRSADEVRDISVVRWIDGGWTEPTPVGAEGWVIAGCPVNGPAISAFGRTVAVAWHTEAADQPQSRVAFSTRGGGNFGEPIRIDLGDSDGRVDVVLLDESAAVVGWMENGQFLIRRVATDGVLGKPVTVAQIDGSRKSGFPQIARGPHGIVLAWTDVNPTGSGVRTAHLPWERLP